MYINYEFVAVKLPLEWGHLVLIIKTIINMYKNGKLETATTISKKKCEISMFSYTSSTAVTFCFNYFNNLKLCRSVSFC